jgi:hypothetical protein
MKTALSLVAAGISFIACAPEKPPVKLIHVAIAEDGNGVVISTPDGIVCGTRCTADMPEGTHLTLQARADPGNRLASWDGNCAAVTGEIVDLDLKDELICVAHFVKVTAPTTPPVTHKLTVIALGPGNVTATTTPALRSIAATPPAAGRSPSTRWSASLRPRIPARKSWASPTIASDSRRPKRR